MFDKWLCYLSTCCALRTVLGYWGLVRGFGIWTRDRRTTLKVQRNRSRSWCSVLFRRDYTVCRGGKKTNSKCHVI